MEKCICIYTIYMNIYRERKRHNTQGNNHIWFEQNSILWKEGWLHTNVVAIIAKFDAVSQKLTCLYVITTKGLTKSITALTVMRSV